MFCGGVSCGMRLLLSGFDHGSVVFFVRTATIVSRCDRSYSAHVVDSLFDAYPSLLHFHPLSFTSPLIYIFFQVCHQDNFPAPLVQWYSTFPYIMSCKHKQSKAGAWGAPSCSSEWERREFESHRGQSLIALVKLIWRWR